MVFSQTARSSREKAPAEESRASGSNIDDEVQSPDTEAEEQKTLAHERGSFAVQVKIAFDKFKKSYAMRRPTG